MNLKATSFLILMVLAYQAAFADEATCVYRGQEKSLPLEWSDQSLNSVEFNFSNSAGVHSARFQSSDSFTAEIATLGSEFQELHVNEATADNPNLTDNDPIDNVIHCGPEDEKQSCFVFGSNKPLIVPTQFMLNEFQVSITMNKDGYRVIKVKTSKPAKITSYAGEDKPQWFTVFRQGLNKQFFFCRPQHVP